MMTLGWIFSNPKVQKVLANFGIFLLIVLALSVIVAFFSVPVWCLTHSIHHSTFTWWITWVVWILIGLGTIITIAVNSGD